MSSKSHFVAIDGLSPQEKAPKKDEADSAGEMTNTNAAILAQAGMPLEDDESQDD